MSGFEKLVVVKRMHARLRADASFVAMFAHEARLATGFAHPNVVQTFDAGEIDGRLFLAMEHLHGVDAHAALEAARATGRPAMPIEHAVTVGIAACSALAYVHERCDASGIPLGVVHRDVCLRNVVLGFGGDVKLVDFGIAKSDLEEAEDTPVATLKGKVGYMSPEQVSGGPVDARTDIFSLGVVLFELTTGRLPFRGRNDLETFTLVRDAPCPSPGSILASFPPALERILLRALQKDPAHRYPTARAFEADLQRFARDAGLVDAADSHAQLGAWMRVHFADRLEEHAALLDTVPAVLASLPPISHRAPPPPGPDSGEAITQLMSHADAPGLRARAPSVPPTSSASGSAWPAGPASVHPATASIHPPAPALRTAPLLVTLGAAALVGSVAAVVYVARGIQREMAARTSLLRTYHEEEAVRTAASVDPSETAGALEVTSNPPGSGIWINGAARTEVTPVTLDKLPIGKELNVKIAKEGYETFRSTLRLTDETPFKLVAAEMKPMPATVVLHVDPPLV
ncbi:MAG: protein kinase domain-containing protein, partial [Polyangiaceae bacterium]